MALKPGTKMRSTVCDAEVVIVKATEDGDLTCGGAPLVPSAEAGEPTGDVDAAFSDGVLLGKRYTNEAGTIELLAVKAGKGSLALNGVALEIKSAKALPASD